MLTAANATRSLSQVEAAVADEVIYVPALICKTNCIIMQSSQAGTTLSEIPFPVKLV